MNAAPSSRFYDVGDEGERDDIPSMDTADGTAGEIQFHLSIRPSMHGRSDIVLRLCRGERVASETVISTVADGKARMILLMSRMQLFRLGYDEHVPTLSHAVPVAIGTECDE